jgi:hypothetical protein
MNVALTSAPPPLLLLLREGVAAALGLSEGSMCAASQQQTPTTQGARSPSHVGKGGAPVEKSPGAPCLPAAPRRRDRDRRLYGARMRLRSA